MLTPLLALFTIAGPAAGSSVQYCASYNGVRSDSVQFSFPSGCKDHDHLYHGPKVNNQVPPR